MEIDKWEDAEINSVNFNFEKDIADFDVEGMRIYTNGNLVLFGD